MGGCDVSVRGATSPMQRRRGGGRRVRKGERALGRVPCCSAAVSRWAARGGGDEGSNREERVGRVSGRRVARHGGYADGYLGPDAGCTRQHKGAPLTEAAAAATRMCCCSSFRASTGAERAGGSSGGRSYVRTTGLAAGFAAGAAVAVFVAGFAAVAVGTGASCSGFPSEEGISDARSSCAIQYRNENRGRYAM